MTEDIDISTFFDVYGPFPIQHHRRKVPHTQLDLWELAEKRDEGLASAIGCYLFGLSFRGKLTPWYVGMTVAQAGFKAEAFQPHKIGIYNGILADHPGKPILFFFPLMTPEEKFSKARTHGKKVIGWLERTLMALAFGRNPEISNVRDMKFLRNVEVLGLLGPKRTGRPYREAAEIRKMLLQSKI
jgi:hypothetical protein